MTDTEDPPVAPATAVRAISLKLPPFRPADPDMWFAQVEAQFSTRGITVERTKYDYIIAALSPATATEVRDLILNPPPDTPYTVLMKELIWRTAGSNQQKLQKLFNEVELGDQKPSQLLRRMRQLWPCEGTNEGLLRELFLKRLPSNMRMVLAPSGEEISLDNLAEVADHVMEVSVPSVAAVRAPPPPSTSAELESLRSEVHQLQEMMRSLSVHPRHRSPTPARRHSPSQPETTPSAGTINVLETPPPSAAHPAAREMIRPDASVPGPVPSRLFHIMDHACGLRFLVDTGAVVRVLPPSRTERKRPHDSLTLQAVNSTPITTYGTRSLVSAAPFVGYSSSRMSSNPSLVQISSAILTSSST